jgi:hypothetical protein
MDYTDQDVYEYVAQNSAQFQSAAEVAGHFATLKADALKARMRQIKGLMAAQGVVPNPKYKPIKKSAEQRRLDEASAEALARSLAQDEQERQDYNRWSVARYSDNPRLRELAKSLEAIDVAWKAARARNNKAQGDPRVSQEDKDALWKASDDLRKKLYGGLVQVRHEFPRLATEDDKECFSTYERIDAALVKQREAAAAASARSA